MPRPRKHCLSPLPYGAHYHCISRVVDRNFVFHKHERAIFATILRQVEAFTGIRVITWTMLSNHFHVLVHITPPPPAPLTNEEILERCRSLYSPNGMTAIEVEFNNATTKGGHAIDLLRNKFLKRMWNLSEFMKTLKQKFTSWFNRKHARVGTLWESRFSSVLVEGSYKCLLKVAAYIDLNAVRANIVTDPKDYPWCGYAEAASGKTNARVGLASAFDDPKPNTTWRDLNKRYRNILFGIAETTSPTNTNPATLSPQAIATALASGEKLTPAQLLRCRLRHFTDGLALGSEAFIEAFFKSKRTSFSIRRKNGARRLRGGDWGDLRCIRDLAKSPISPASTTTTNSSNTQHK